MTMEEATESARSVVCQSPDTADAVAEPALSPPPCATQTLPAAPASATAPSPPTLHHTVTSIETVPPKKRSAFSISSILGEDEGSRSKIARTATHGNQDGESVDVEEGEVEEREEKERKLEAISGEKAVYDNIQSNLLSSRMASPYKATGSAGLSSPPTSPAPVTRNNNHLPHHNHHLFGTTSPASSSAQLPAFPPHGGVTGAHLTSPQEAVKYNAILAAHLANPELASKLCRWPLLWNPWMAAGMQGPGFPAALPRPPFFGQIPVSMAQEGSAMRKAFEDSKELLEAGEIIRPVACRRPSLPVHISPTHATTGKPHYLSPSALDPRSLHNTSPGRGDESSMHTQTLANRSASNSPVTSQSGAPHPFTASQLAVIQLRSPLQNLSSMGHQVDLFKASSQALFSSEKARDFGESLKSGSASLQSDLDKDGDMVEIDIDEDLSDNEADDSGNLDSNGDDLSKSNCERKKKTRTVFSRSQIFQLETMFDMKRYLSSSERSGLAKALNMTETQVKIWFQNRRNKWKRQIAAEMEAANMSQVGGQRLLQLPYMYSHEELSRAGMRSANMSSLAPSLAPPPPPSSHPVVPPSVHHYYGNMLRAHTS